MGKVIGHPVNIPSVSLPQSGRQHPQIGRRGNVLRRRGIRAPFPRGVGAQNCRCVLERLPGAVFLQVLLRPTAKQVDALTAMLRDPRDLYNAALQGIGMSGVHQHRPVLGAIKTISVKRENRRWYAVLSCDDVPTQPLERTGRGHRAGSGQEGGIELTLTTGCGR